MIIRKAVLEDLDFIVEEGIKFLEYHPMNIHIAIDVSHLDSLVSLLIKDHIVLIAEDSGNRLGMISGIYTPHIYNPLYTVVQELFWWVLPEYRSTTAAFKLLKAFEIEAKQIGASVISMVSTIYTPTLDKVYKRYKYRPVESSYFKEL